MHLLNTIHPTESQLKILATIVSLQDKPVEAAEEISVGANMVAARNLLMKLNLITYSPDSAALTDQGARLARDHDIVDDNGQLTDKGQQLLPVQSSPSNGEDSMTPPMSDANMGMDQPMGEIPGSPTGFESFSPLFKSLLKG